jgi:hypothetical protein
MSKNEVTKTVKTELQNSTFINEEFLQLCKEKAGMENIDSRDIKTPYINIIQSLSPQRKKNHEAYIPGCEEGDITISSTKEIRKTLKFIFCASEKSFPEYSIDDQGTKVFVQRHMDEAILDVCEKGNGIRKGYFTKEGNEIVPTRVCYVLVENEDGTFTKAVINLKKSNLSSWKELATLISNQKLTVDGTIISPPPFSFKYSAETKIEIKGANEFFVFKFSDLKTIVTENEFTQAKNFYYDFKKNNIKISEESFSDELSIEASKII